MSFVVRGIQVNIGQWYINQCGLPSAASLNCLVSTFSRESRPHPRSSLYIQYIVIPSLAVHSFCIPQCKSDPSLIWARQAALYIASSLLVNPFELLFFEFRFDLGPSFHTHKSLFTIFMRLSYHCTNESSSGYSG